MKISVVITVLNEEKTVSKLLESLFEQTKKPDEIVIVDGGSSDKTVAELKAQSSKLKSEKVILRIFIRPGSSIAQGRNFAIKKAKNEIIAMTDAGCIAKEDWFEKITQPFKDKDVNLVAGFYEMTGDSPLQKAVAPFHGVPPEHFNQMKFLPSARSIAFRKKLWEVIGGFNENLERAGEDTLFNFDAIKRGAKIVRVKDAIVYWEVPKTLKESLKKFYYYAKGDAQAGIWWHPTQQIATHNIKIASIFLRYFIGFLLFLLSFIIPVVFLILVLLFTTYLLWPIWKMQDAVTDPRARAWLPIIQILSDFVVMIGFLVGLFSTRRFYSSISFH